MDLHSYAFLIRSLAEPVRNGSGTGAERRPEAAVPLSMLKTGLARTMMAAGFRSKIELPMAEKTSLKPNLLLK